MKFTAFTLTSVLIVSCLLIGVTVSEYDPWYDFDDDGDIDIFDVVQIATKYGTSGEPFVAKSALEYDSGWVDISELAGQRFNVTHNLNSTNLIVDISGKTTIDGGVHQRSFGCDKESGWQQRYIDNGPDASAFSLIQTLDDSYVFAGYTEAMSHGNRDFWLVKTDEDGYVIWSQLFGGVNQDDAYCGIQTTDKGYLVAGGSNSFGGNFDAWLVKTDADGNMEWNQTYGGADDDWAYSVIQTADGGYAFTGETRSYGVSLTDFWLVKTDANGTMEWNQTYGGVIEEQAYALVQTSDGGYALAGQTNSFGAGGYDFWLVKTDGSGNHQWNQTYGGTEDDHLATTYRVGSMISTSDMGFALVGQTRSFGEGGYDAWFVKTDMNGVIQWNKTYGKNFDEGAGSILQTADMGYALAGWGFMFHQGFWLLKTDINGDAQWERVYAEANENHAMCLVQTHDGGYALVGYTGSNPSGVVLVKTRAEAGLAWTDSTTDCITLYRGATDPYWNYVRVQIWRIKETP